MFSLKQHTGGPEKPMSRNDESEDTLEFGGLSQGDPIPDLPCRFVNANLPEDEDIWAKFFKKAKMSFKHFPHDGFELPNPCRYKCLATWRNDMRRALQSQEHGLGFDEVIVIVMSENGKELERSINYRTDGNTQVSCQETIDMFRLPGAATVDILIRFGLYGASGLDDYEKQVFEHGTEKTHAIPATVEQEPLAHVFLQKFHDWMTDDAALIKLSQHPTAPHFRNWGVLNRWIISIPAMSLDAYLLMWLSSDNRVEFVETMLFGPVSKIHRLADAVAHTYGIDKRPHPQQVICTIIALLTHSNIGDGDRTPELESIVETHALMTERARMYMQSLVGAN